MSICAGADWGLSDYQMALISSIVFIGQLVGSAIFGPVADSYGRHTAFAISSIIITIGGIMSGFAHSYLWLILFRGLVGIGVGKYSTPLLILPFLSRLTAPVSLWLSRRNLCPLRPLG
jgi:MFS family permease